MLPSVLATTGHRWDKGQDLPIEERVWGTPTAWKAKEGEVVAVGLAPGVGGRRRRMKVGILLLFLLFFIFL